MIILKRIFLFLLGIFFLTFLGMQNIYADDNSTATVNDSSSFKNAIESNSITTINLDSDITVNGNYSVGKNNLIINGNKHSLKFGSNALTVNGTGTGSADIEFNDLNIYGNNPNNLNPGYNSTGNIGTINFRNGISANVYYYNINFYGRTLMSATPNSNVVGNFDGTGSVNSYVTNSYAPSIVSEGVKMGSNSDYDFKTLNGNCIEINANHVMNNLNAKNGIYLDDNANLNLIPNSQTPSYGSALRNAQDCFSAILFSWSTQNAEDNYIEENNGASLNIDSNGDKSVPIDDKGGIVIPSKPLLNSAIYRGTNGNSDNISIKLNQSSDFNVDASISYPNSYIISLLRDYQAGIKVDVEDGSKFKVDAGPNNYSQGVFWTKGFDFKAGRNSSFQILRRETTKTNNYLINNQPGNNSIQNSSISISNPEIFELNNYNASIIINNTGTPFNITVNNGGYFSSEGFYRLKNTLEDNLISSSHNLNINFNRGTSLIPSYSSDNFFVDSGTINPSSQNNLSSNEKNINNFLNDLKNGYINKLKIVNPNIEVHYVNKDNQSQDIVPKTILEGKIDEEVTASPKEIDGWKYTNNMGSSVTRTLGHDNDPIYFKYKKIKSASVKINYIGDDGKTIKTKTINNATIGDNYSDLDEVKNHENFDGYDYDNNQTISGTVKESDNVINLKYQKKYPLNVKYMSKNGTSLGNDTLNIHKNDNIYNTFKSSTSFNKQFTNYEQNIDNSYYQFDDSSDKVYFKDNKNELYNPDDNNSSIVVSYDEKPKVTLKFINDDTNQEIPNYGFSEYGDTGQDYSNNVMNKINNPDKKIDDLTFNKIERNYDGDDKFGENNTNHTLIFHYKKYSVLIATFKSINFERNGKLNSDILLNSVSNSKQKVDAIDFDDQRINKKPIDISLKQTNQTFNNDDNSSDSVNGNLYYKSGNTYQNLNNNELLVASNFNVQKNNSKFCWDYNNQLLFKFINEGSNLNNTNNESKQYTAKDAITWNITDGLS